MKIDLNQTNDSVLEYEMKTKFCSPAPQNLDLPR